MSINEAIEEKYFCLYFCSIQYGCQTLSCQVRWGSMLCPRAALHCVHFPMVLPGLPSGHPPRQMPGPSHLLEKMISMMQPWCTSSAHWPPPLMRFSHFENLVKRISIRKMSQMSIQRQLTLTDDTGNKSRLSLSQQMLVGHKVWPAIAKDSPNRPGTEGVKSPFQIPGESSSLTSEDQDWKHQGPEY